MNHADNVKRLARAYAQAAHHAARVMKNSNDEELWDAALKAADKTLAEHDAAVDAMALGEPVSWQPIETAPKDEFILLAAEFDGPGDWRIKTGEYRTQPDEYGRHWHPLGASWTPTRWMTLPPPPGAQGVQDTPTQQKDDSDVRSALAKFIEVYDAMNCPRGPTRIIAEQVLSDSWAQVSATRQTAATGEVLTDAEMSTLWAESPFDDATQETFEAGRDFMHQVERAVLEKLQKS